MYDNFSYETKFLQKKKHCDIYIKFMLIFNFSKGTSFVFASNDLFPIFKNLVVCFVGMCCLYIQNFCSKVPVQNHSVPNIKD